MHLTPLLLVGLTAGLATGLAAQNPVEVETKMPRPPQVGPDLKLPGVLPAKDRADLLAPPVAGQPGAVTLPQKPMDPRQAKALADAFVGQVFFDIDPHGRLLVAAETYKVQCADDGFTFVARPADAAANSEPILFATKSVTLDGIALPVQHNAPLRNGSRVAWQRGGCVEALDLRPEGAEQTFTFYDLPRRGELVVDIAVTTARVGHARGDALVFTGATGDVNYSKAIAIDAAGRRIDIATHYLDGAITMRVPAAFVASATLPLVIDPILSSGTSYTTTATIAHADMAFDESSDTYMVAFERWFSADDIDVFCQIVDSAMLPVGSVTVVDTTLDVWQKPKIANLNLYDRYLVAAQVSTDAPSPYWIAGRVVGNVGALLSNQFLIENPALSGFSGDKLVPDVGGDPYLVGPVYWTVVWERAASATDHDVHMKQVQFDGTLRTNNVTLIQNNSTFQTAPSISKSDGPGASSQQRWLVTYEEAYSPADHDIRGSLITWDGQIALVAGQATFAIDTSLYFNGRPEVSSPTDDVQRKFLVVYDNLFLNAGDVEMTCVDTTGAVLGRANLNGIETPSVQAWPQYSPCVDTDGSRFAVSYTEIFQGTGTDQDIRASLVAWSGVQLVVHDSRAVPGFTSDPEINSAIASSYSSSGHHDVRFGIACTRIGATSSAIDVDVYGGYPAGGGFSLRSTGCGNLTINPNGLAVLGQTFGFTFTQSYPLMGFVAGFPANVPVGPCPGCVLGVNGSALLIPSYALTLPNDAGLFGVQLAVQGFAFSGGSCLGSISLSDTYDVQIR